MARRPASCCPTVDDEDVGAVLGRRARAASCACRRAASAARGACRRARCARRAARSSTRGSRCRAAGTIWSFVVPHPPLLPGLRRARALQRDRRRARRGPDDPLRRQPGRAPPTARSTRSTRRRSRSASRCGSCSSRSRTSPSPAGCRSAERDAASTRNAVHDGPAKRARSDAGRREGDPYVAGRRAASGGLAASRRAVGLAAGAQRSRASAPRELAAIQARACRSLGAVCRSCGASSCRSWRPRYSSRLRSSAQLVFNDTMSIYSQGNHCQVS